MLRFVSFIELKSCSKPDFPQHMNKKHVRKLGSKATSGIPANYHVKNIGKIGSLGQKNMSFIGFLGLNYRNFIGIEDPNHRL